VLEGGAGVKVGVGVSVEGTGVSVGGTDVWVGATVGVGVGMGVDVSVGIGVGVLLGVGVGDSVGVGLGVSVGGRCAGVGETVAGLDVGCAAMGAEVGETDMGGDAASLQPSNSNITNDRPNTRSRYILGYICLLTYRFSRHSHANSTLRRSATEYITADIQ